MAFPQIAQSDMQTLEGNPGKSFDITLPQNLTTGDADNLEIRGRLPEHMKEI